MDLGYKLDNCKWPGPNMELVWSMLMISLKIVIEINNSNFVSNQIYMSMEI